MNRTMIAGWMAVLGGLMLFADLALRLLSGLDQSYFVVASLMALCMAGAPLGLHFIGAYAPGWRALLARVGTAIVLLGVALWLVAFAMLFANPAAAFTQRLTPGGSLLMAVGMVALGIAVFASGRLRGWRRALPLCVGLYFPLQLGFQLAFFLNGRDSAPGPNGALLGVWGLLWALLGYVILSEARADGPNLAEQPAVRGLEV
jgi:hypothetical protein